MQQSFPKNVHTGPLIGSSKTGKGPGQSHNNNNNNTPQTSPTHKQQQHHHFGHYPVHEASLHSATAPNDPTEPPSHRRHHQPHHHQQHPHQSSAATSHPHPVLPPAIHQATPHRNPPPQHRLPSPTPAFKVEHIDSSTSPGVTIKPEPPTPSTPPASSSTKFNINNIIPSASAASRSPNHQSIPAVIVSNVPSSIGGKPYEPTAVEPAGSAYSLHPHRLLEPSTSPARGSAGQPLPATSLDAAVQPTEAPVVRRARLGKSMAREMMMMSQQQQHPHVQPMPVIAPTAADAHLSLVQTPQKSTSIPLQPTPFPSHYQASALAPMPRNQPPIASRLPIDLIKEEHMKIEDDDDVVCITNDEPEPVAPVAPVAAGLLDNRSTDTATTTCPLPATSHDEIVNLDEDETSTSSIASVSTSPHHNNNTRIQHNANKRRSTSPLPHATASATSDDCCVVVDVDIIDLDGNSMSSSIMDLTSPSQVSTASSSSLLMLSAAKKPKILELYKIGTTAQAKKSPPNSYKSLIKPSEPKPYLCNAERRGSAKKSARFRFIRGEQRYGVQQRQVLINGKHRKLVVNSGGRGPPAKRRIFKKKTATAKAPLDGTGVEVTDPTAATAATSQAETMDLTDEQPDIKIEPKLEVMEEPSCTDQSITSSTTLEAKPIPVDLKPKFECIEAPYEMTDKDHCKAASLADAIVMAKPSAKEAFFSSLDETIERVAKGYFSDQEILASVKRTKQQRCDKHSAARSKSETTKPKSTQQAPVVSDAADSCITASPKKASRDRSKSASSRSASKGSTTTEKSKSPKRVKKVVSTEATLGGDQAAADEWSIEPQPTTNRQSMPAASDDDDADYDDYQMDSTDPANYNNNNNNNYYMVDETPLLKPPPVPPSKPARASAAKKPRSRGAKFSNRKRHRARNANREPSEPEEDVVLAPRRSTAAPRWSNGWNWQGPSHQGKVFLNVSVRVDLSARIFLCI